MELNNEFTLPVIPSDKSICETCIIAQNYIRELEEAVIVGGFLTEIYSFDPDLVNQVPTFTPEEKAFARSWCVCGNNLRRYRRGRWSRWLCYYV